ncbi:MULTISPECIES: hypothetical protein [Pseudomonas]|uniref:hypothetical protein n=1 Tax=Pseudomonas TaxID=286 RepID=UPI000FC41900|nr:MULTISPECIES: hypothetical protein [Pseudomonas]RUE17052.1 hypothetical protein IPC1222_25410 [Pseudomonas aeruginosa]CAH0135356.1 hypothetical protein SRABI111_00323 [Pseudomonas carnis]CAH0138338.1 hypothetical protein SRABI110_00467 [Pseudomonas carnis]CAH0158793.1 hypothetical protein SRABI64_00725 [Pseudomonas carnis]CAH0201363.1 hypothetical protein SRABI08_01901 [Pseudomonas carnis]
MISIKNIADVIEGRYNINSTWLYKTPASDKFKKARIEIRIKEVLGDRFTIKDRNAISRCLTTTYMNHVYGLVPDRDFVSLSDYLKKHKQLRVRISDLKNILAEENYLFDGFPTMNAYKEKKVFTKFRNKGEIIKLWKISFLHKIISRHAVSLNLPTISFETKKKAPYRG